MNSVTQDNDSDDKLFVGVLKKDIKTDNRQDECFVSLDIQGTKIRFKVDTGSQANMMPTSKLEQLKPRPHIEKTHTRLLSYTGEDLPVCGQCTLQCQNRNLEFDIVETQQEPVFKFPSLTGSGYSQDSSEC